MNELNWAREHTTAAALDGLSPEESVRFEATADDAAKREANELRAADAALRELFAPMAPGPVEVASVGRLRQEWTQVTVERGWQRKLAFGLAASVCLGVIGAGVNSMGGLSMPGGHSLAFWEQSSSGTFDFVSAKVNTPSPRIYREAMETEPSRSLDRLADDTRLSLQSVKSHLSAPGSGGTPSSGLGLPALATTDESLGREYFALLPGKEKMPASGPGARPGLATEFGKSKDNYYGYVQPTEPGRNLAESEKRDEKKGDVEATNREKFQRDQERSRATALNFKAQVNHLDDVKLAVNAPATVPQPPAETAPPAAPPPSARKIIIRSGEIEFEVESFDGSVAVVTKLVLGIPGAFVGTVNSEKMANGKVKGSVVVRVPPEALDSFVLDIRRDLGKGGELKGQRIGSQDITKQYTDLESRLKAARTMETRLLEIIKTGKGEIKQLLEAEKELGVWRTKIEEIEGELRYYGNLASLSTLTITMAEKEIRTAASLTETERVAAGVEVEEVEKAYRALQAAVSELKGRVIKAEVKQHSFGQSASMVFEVTPESAGPARDRLAQIGHVARLGIERSQASDGQPVPRDTKVKKGDTVFDVQLYNLNNVRPRETVTQQVAVPNVAKSFASLREAVTKAGGRVLNANLNEQDKQNVTAAIDFEVKRADEATLRAAFDGAGETTSRVVARANEGDTITDAKVLYRATLFSTEKITPRERVVLASEVADVDGLVAQLDAHVVQAGGKKLDETSSRDRGKVTTKVVYQLPLAASLGLSEKVKGAGLLRVTQSTRDPNAPDGSFALARYEVTLTNEERIVAADDGVWPQVRKGLSYSATVLLTSVTWVVFGLCVVLPWALVGYGVFRFTKRMTREKTA
jgi:hypothetical protein